MLPLHPHYSTPCLLQGFLFSLRYRHSLHTKTHLHHGGVSFYPTDQGLRVQKVMSFSQVYQKVAKSSPHMTANILLRPFITDALLSPLKFTPMGL